MNSTSEALELGSDVVERSAQIRSDRGHSNNGCDRDESRDQRIFDCGSATVFLQKPEQDRVHLFDLSSAKQSKENTRFCFRQKQTN